GEPRTPALSSEGSGPEGRGRRALNRFVAVHGHFYQPPRENPWTGEIDREVTAAPYHDWNERITAECYTPNGSGNPSNYSRMSFNFGPTLLSWLEANGADTY